MPCLNALILPVLPLLQILAVLGTILVASGLSGRQSAEQDTLLQMNEMYRLRQQAARQSLFGGWSTVTPAQFDGRCRCTGYKTYNPDQRVVCACTGAPGGDNKDLWRKGPWKILTGCMFSSGLSESSTKILMLLHLASQLWLSISVGILHVDFCVCVLTILPPPLESPIAFFCFFSFLGVSSDTVVVDRSDDNPKDHGKYLTIQVCLRKCD